MTSPTAPPGSATATCPPAATTGFASADQDRAFHLLLPEGLGQAEAPAPLFISLTGTVQEELAFLEQSGLDQLPDDGWVVLAPVRNDNGKV